MPQVFENHIPITPFHPDLVLNGIRAVKEFHESQLKRLEWPQEKTVRKANGGDGGEIVTEQIRVIWEQGRLVFPVSEQPQALAERGRDQSIIQYNGLFLAQLDGEVAYQPSDQNVDFFYILVENVDHKLNVIRFSAEQTVVVDPFVKHSMPIPSRFGLEYTVYHRSVNAVERFLSDSNKLPIFNIMKVDRQTLIASGRIPQKSLASGHDHFSLPKHFSKKLLPLEEVSEGSFKPFGQIIQNPSHVEAPSDALWPGATTPEGWAGVLEQDFQMSWVSNEMEAKELLFKGLSGSFAGDQGRPGVEYQPDLGIYKANLLLTRPDGTFFLKTASSEAAFVMAFALSKNDKGEPDENTLRAFIFQGDKSIRLPPFVWHTVPIPLANQESVLLSEVVSATNATITIDVQTETGHPIQFAQAI